MSALIFFQNEIQSIRNEKMKEFLIEALARIPEFYNDQIFDYNFNVVRAVRQMAMTLEVEDIPMDAIVIAALLHNMCQYPDDLSEADVYGYLKVRGKLFDLQSIIGRDEFDAIMRLIESQEGLRSILPQVQPMLNEPPHMWLLSFAVDIAKEYVLVRRN